MSPRINAFNGGIRSRLERLVREYAKQYGEVYVITGSVLQEPLQRLTSGRVAIPSGLYKVIVHSTGTATPGVFAVVLPHIPFRPPAGIKGTHRARTMD